MKEKKEINILIGNKIKIQREKAGFTQEKFSELIGLETKSISSIECGTVGISLTTMKKICELLAISADELLFDVTYDNEIDELSSKLNRLDSQQFEITKSILQKLFESFMLHH